jgi:hypothetical protein
MRVTARAFCPARRQEPTHSTDARIFFLSEHWFICFALEYTKFYVGADEVSTEARFLNEHLHGAVCVGSIGPRPIWWYSAVAIFLHRLLTARSAVRNGAAAAG